jgi:aspartate--ammonia ligase
MFMTYQTDSVEISSAISMLQTEEMTDFIKSGFEKILARNLNIVKVSSPVIVLDGTGINDDLNGVEQPVSFPVKALNNQSVSIIQSLAKWKRIRLKYYQIEPGKGILTDMRALRPCEVLTPIHSIYVDQWDWEKHILPEQRSLKFLKQTIESIYDAIREMEGELYNKYPWLIPQLPKKISFFHSEELLRKYPEMTVKQRENEIARIHGAVFIIGIGNNLSNGEPHDGRAPDYDDWSSLNEDGYYGLNGDIILWNPVMNSSLEISSMGIRVNKESMEKQLEIRNCQDRKNLFFHRLLLDQQLPLSIGGGIGQSRLCMFLLRKSHIGEVQSSIWSEEIVNQYEEMGMKLL